MTLVEEAEEEFLLCAHLMAHQVVKLTLDGRVVWKIEFPTESGCYQQRDDFKPTAVVGGPNGSIFVADGYGASVIHEFDSQRRYLKSFGGVDAGVGQLRNCHGLALDMHGPLPRLLVCDRRNRRLVHFDLEGRFVGVVAEGLRRPSSVAFSGDLLAVAELEGRVSLLDRGYRCVAVLGDNPDQTLWANYDITPAQWRPGMFNAPHGMCFDRDGHLFVQEWNRTGRLTRFLRHSSL